MGAVQGAGSTLESCLYQLRSDPALLVLDNCEHVSDKVAQTVSLLLDGAPETRFVLTSRKALKIAGEQIVPVGPLRQSAVQLFKERVAALAPETKLQGETARITRICERLDRLPLAIELAAARLRSMTLADLEAKIEEGTDVLKGSEHAPIQHETMSSSIQWSVSLLDEPERTALARACLFPAGFTLAAAEAVFPDTPDERGGVLDLVTGLVDNSLLIFDSATGRFGTLYIVRQWVLDNLADNIGDAARDRLVDWWSDHARQIEAGASGVHLERVVESYRLEFQNVCVAVKWSFQDAARIERSSDMWRLFGLVCLRTSKLDVGDELFAHAHRVAAGRAGATTQAMVAASWSSLLIDLGRSAEAVTVLESVLERLEDVTDPEVRVRVQANLSLATLNVGRHRRTIELAQAAEVRALDIGAFSVAAVASRVLAIAYAEIGEFESAHASIRRSKAIAAREGDAWREIQARLTEVEILVEAGRLDEALAELPGVVESCRENDYTFSVVSSLIVAVQVLARLGELEAARACVRPCFEANAVFGPARLRVVQESLCNEIVDLPGSWEEAMGSVGEPGSTKEPVSRVVRELELAYKRRRERLAR